MWEANDRNRNYLHQPQSALRLGTYIEDDAITKKKVTMMSCTKKIVSDYEKENLS